MAARVFSPDKNLHAFGEWIVSKGGFIYESLVFTSPDSTHGSQILTTSPIAPNTRLLSCPHALAIDYPKVQAQFPPSVPPHAALCLFLCDQWLLAESSPWWPYLRILPREFDTPLYFSPEDLQWLQGCNLNSDEVASRIASWKSELEAATTALHAEGANTEQYTWELFLWAATVFSSRSFPGKLINWTIETSMTAISDPDCLPALFPLIDSVNHQPFTKITWQPSLNALDVVSGDSIPAAGEVCNNYGPKSNEELLLGYGFTIPSNPFDTVPLRFSPALSPGQRAIRALQGHPDDGVYHLTPRNGASLYPRALVDLFRILTAAPSEVALLRERQEVDVTRRNTLAVHVQLSLALRRKLALFPVEEALPPVGGNGRRRCAKVYRDAQVEILEAAVEESEGVVKTVLGEPGTVTLGGVLEGVFGRAVEVCFGDVTEVGMEDVVMALFVCWKWISRDEGWKRWFERVGGPGEEDEDGEREVYDELFPAVGEAVPEVFGGVEWTPGVVRWGMGVFEGEGVRVGGEWVLCVE